MIAKYITNLKRDQEGKCKQNPTHHPFQNQCEFPFIAFPVRSTNKKDRSAQPASTTAAPKPARGKGKDKGKNLMDKSLEGPTGQCICWSFNMSSRCRNGGLHICTEPGYHTAHELTATFLTSTTSTPAFAFCHSSIYTE